MRRQLKLDPDTLRKFVGFLPTIHVLPSEVHWKGSHAEASDDVEEAETRAEKLVADAKLRFKGANHILIIFIAAWLAINPNPATTPWISGRILLEHFPYNRWYRFKFCDGRIDFDNADAHAIEYDDILNLDAATEALRVSILKFIGDGGA